jgi:hypothetical protein
MTEMDLPEDQRISFVIKLWVEEVDEDTGEVKWRGRITEVVSGELRYLENLDEIKPFIAQYLAAREAKFGLR